MFNECMENRGPKLAYTMVIISAIFFLILEITMGNVDNIKMYGFFILAICLSNLFTAVLIEYDWSVLIFTIIILIPLHLYYLTKTGLYHVQFIDNIIQKY